MLADLKFAFRQMLKHRGFTAVAVLTLALGIGINTTMFSVLNALVLQASPAPESGRLVTLLGTSAQSQDRFMSPGDYFDYQRQNTSLEKVGAYYWNNFNLAEPGQPAARLKGMSVSGDFFSAFGIRPNLGRVVGPENDKPGASQIAVLSDGFWRSHYAADPNIIGRTVRMDGAQVAVIGVMPPEFDNVLYWGHIDLWVSLNMDAASRQTRDNSFMRAVGRLRPGVTLGQAAAEASAFAARLAHDFPLTDAGNGLRVASWNKERTGALSANLSWLCMGLAGFVLLIACANLANLQLARMTDRVREGARALLVPRRDSKPVAGVGKREVMREPGGERARLGGGLTQGDARPEAAHGPHEGVVAGLARRRVHVERYPEVDVAPVQHVVELRRHDADDRDLGPVHAHGAPDDVRVRGIVAAPEPVAEDRDLARPG